MTKIRRKRKSYTETQRATILSAAQKDGLTAFQVQKKFGVTPVTYYSWRKKTGLSGRPGKGLRLGGAGLPSQVRSAVQSKVREILPNIVRSEVSSYLNTLLASGRGRRRLRT